MQSCTATVMWQNHDVIFTFLILTVHFLHLNSKTHKNIGRKIKFHKLNFCNGANFNNFHFAIWGQNREKKFHRYFFSQHFSPSKILPISKKSKKEKQERKKDSKVRKKSWWLKVSAAKLLRNYIKCQMSASLSTILLNMFSYSVNVY